MAAVMALALSGLLVLAMTGVFIGIGKGFTATIERSGADIMIMQPGATSLIGGPSGVPRRFIPLAYRHPEVVEVKPLDGAGGSFQSIKTYDPTMSQAERAKMKAPRREFVQTVIIDTAPGSVTIPRDYSQELVDALRQPYTVAVDETALTKLGVQLGDRALYNGRTVTVVGVTRGYPNMMQSTIVMSRDTLRMVGQSDEGPRVGPLMIKISDPARAQVVAAQLTAMGDGQWKAWTRQELADANAGAMFEEGILVIIIGGCVVLGTIIGIFPGAGATIASFISYNLAQHTSREPETFGSGAVDGVVASEAANSSSVGGALIPLLALGIPGSATDAVLIGALQLHDITPGPLLFESNPEIVYGIFTSLLIANAVMLILGYYGVRLFAKVVEVPTSILYPMILAIALIGSFAVRNSFFDVGACVGFGLTGWIFKRYGYPVAPVVLGIVLGNLLEENFRRAVMMDGPMVFFTEPFSLVMLVVAAMLFGFPVYRNFKLRR